MKTSKRKVGWLTVVLMTAVLALSGCSGQQEETEAAKTELTWYYAGSPTNSGNEEVFAKVNELVGQKLENTSINFQPLDWGSYEEKMKVIIAGGESYDICWTANWVNNYAQNVNNGAFLALDELLETNAPALKDLLSDEIWEGVKINGSIYGVPAQQIMARSTAVYVPQQAYDKFSDLLENVTTFEDLTPYMEAFANEYGGETAVAKMEWQDLCYAYGIEELLGTGIPGAVMLTGDADDITVFNQYDSDIWKSVISVRKQWTDSGYTKQGISLTNQTDETISRPERLPFRISTYKPGGEEEMAEQQQFPLKAIRISDAYLTGQGATSTLMAISATSKAPERAIEFLELINTDAELYNLMVNGIEGEHYTKLDDNTIKKATNANYGETDWIIGNVFNGYVLEGQPSDIWEQTKAINDTAKQSKLIGFSPNLDPIKLEVNNCKSVIAEYLPALSEGIGDVEALQQEMSEKMKTAGSEKIIAELQTQIDEWLAQK